MEKLKARKKAAEFTGVQIGEFREAFDLFDKDKNGHINASELTDVLNSLGQMPSAEDVKSMLASVDADSNGTIEWDEFLMMMESKARNLDSREEISEAFKVFDLAGDGKITAAILMEAMATHGDVLTEEECEKIVAEVGSDGKSVNFTEFKAMMMGSNSRN